MPVIIASIALALILATASGLVLFSMQEPVYRSQPMESVRVGDPGHNLVGPNWSGNPSQPQGSQRSPDTASRVQG
jgi:hypothetical protein